MEAMLNGPSGQVALGSAALTLGRLPDNTIVMSDVKASGHHAEVRPTAQGYMVVDLGSTNGTFVNGMQLTPHMPQELKSFDVIRIGDVSYTYQGSGASEVAPTVYASPVQGGSPGYQPTVVAPPSSTVYGGYTPQQEYQAAVPPSPYAAASQAPYTPPPPPVYGQQPVGAPVYPGYMPPPQGVPNYPGVPAPTRTQSRRNLYIGGGVLAAVIIGVILFVVLSASSPTKTLNAFCDSLLKHDSLSAYNDLSETAKTTITEQQLAVAFSTVATCNTSNVQQNGSTATGILTMSDGTASPVPFSTTLINENGTWKINILRQG